MSLKNFRYCLQITITFGWIALFATNSVAQSPKFVTTTITSTKHDPPALGRDLWFTMCQNYDRGGGTENRRLLYVNSSKDKWIHIKIGGSTSTSFSPQGSPISIPLAWELNTSGKVEPKAIHVWSDEADLSAYFLSQNSGATEGMFIIPSIGWGVDYVVASYFSLFESAFDYPSEFGLVANRDSTSVQVVPSWDIRESGKPTTVLHARKQLFVERLSKGSCVQYQLTQATNATDYDVTGSLVNSDKPIGVVGAAECSNIPAGYAYCNHICEMIPPIRTWGKNYYSAPFARRYGGDSFRVIASADGQVIYRFDANTGQHVFATLNKYQYWGDDGTNQASRWYSDQPFLLVQYLNSSTWPGIGPSNNGLGNPSMVVLPSVEQFASHNIIQAPTIFGGQPLFQNFFNVIVPTASLNTTYVDGRRISSGTAVKNYIDSNYQIWLFSSASQGTHQIVSDSPVGCYGYGYEAGGSYSWSASQGSTTLYSSDTTAPRVTISGSCFCSTLTIADSGVSQTGLSSIVLDSSSNCSFAPDTNFTPGSGAAQSSYSVCVIDPNQPAFLNASAFDLAGNHTAIATRYLVQATSVTPFVSNFGNGKQGVKHVLFDTISNPTGFTIPILSIRLSNGTLGFTIDSANQTPLRPNEKRLIKIGFSAITSFSAIDTVLVFTACQSKIGGILIGNGGNRDLFVSNLDFGCVYVGDSLLSSSVVITNLSSTRVKIDSIWAEDPKHFTYVGMLPIIMPPNTQSIVPITWQFTPDTVRPIYATAAHYRDTTGIIRSDSLFGCGLSKLGVEEFFSTSMESNPAIRDWLNKKDNGSILLLPARPNPAGAHAEVTFTIGLRERTDVTLRLYDLLGNSEALIFRDLYHPEGIFEVHFDTQKLASGTYIYRLDAKGEARSGRLVIGR